MRLFKYFTTVLLSLSLCVTLSAQNKVVLSGTVVDNSNQPVFAASVVVKSHSVGTYTDEKGFYKLELAPGKYVVEVSLMGYESQEVELSVKSATKKNFVLQENALFLESAKVVGKSKEMTLREGAYAVNAINVQAMVNTVNNLAHAIDRTTGIRVREEGGVGSDFDLSINGMSGNSIRYFIDGMPLDAKGSNVTLANIPVNTIDRVEVYKGVIPASFGTDALGGAINIVTKKAKRNYTDFSYGYGSFSTHKLSYTGQYGIGKTGFVIRPTFSADYSKNNYLMKGVTYISEDRSEFLTGDCRRFHDKFHSLYGRLELGFENRKWADEFFVSGSYSKIDKDIQTGATQEWVYGMVVRHSQSYNVDARYKKNNLFTEGLGLSVNASHTWDHSAMVDTTYRSYDWSGRYIEGTLSELSRNGGKSIRHYKRPLTMVRTNLSYDINASHSIALNYMLNRTGNQQYDTYNELFVPTNDMVMKHFVNLSYNQSFFAGKMNNAFFVKDYVNHLEVRQTEHSSTTGSQKVEAVSTKNYLGYGVGTRYTIVDPASVKLSYEHAVRLPSSRELLGNGSTVYANFQLKPEISENFNLGFFGTWDMGAGHQLSYEANGFVRLVQNYIKATVTEKEGMMQYQNVSAVNVKGVDGEIRYDWRGKLHFMANASFNDSRDNNRYTPEGMESITYGCRVPNKPWTFANAELSYTFHNVGLPSSRLRISYDYQYIHWFYLTWEAFGSASTKPRIPTQHISNVSLLYSWADGRYNISGECTNLFDALAYDNYKLQKPGRGFFLKFRLFL